LHGGGGVVVLVHRVCIHDGVDDHHIIRGLFHQLGDEGGEHGATRDHTVRFLIEEVPVIRHADTDEVIRECRVIRLIVTVEHFQGLMWGHVQEGLTLSEVVDQIMEQGGFTCAGLPDDRSDGPTTDVLTPQVVILVSNE
jgi:hypothetical protein